MGSTQQLLRLGKSLKASRRKPGKCSPTEAQEPQEEASCADQGCCLSKGLNITFKQEKIHTIATRLLQRLITTLTCTHGHSLTWEAEMVQSWTLYWGKYKRWLEVILWTKKAREMMVEL
eukprot:TRINITY_DN3056_c0_g1_i5.p1 TRINITY_DN3056_c0_g1~~TRINITY_DN3056_c0_g1_i5.p1  ORF type:complete len:127 (-),score=46.88 TRINITY_DN3056_c0_g1_i5:129-485(-)